MESLPTPYPPSTGGGFDSVPTPVLSMTPPPTLGSPSEGELSRLPLP